MEDSLLAARGEKSVALSTAQLDRQLNGILLCGPFAGRAAPEDVAHFLDGLGPACADLGRQEREQLLIRMYRAVRDSDHAALVTHPVFLGLDPLVRIVADHDAREGDERRAERARTAGLRGYRRLAAELDIDDCSDDDYSIDLPGPELELVLTAVTTAAVVPFVQALATSAGNRAYETIRRNLRFLARREDPAIAFHPVVTVVRDSSGLRFVVPPELTDVCLEALARADLERLAAPDPDGGSVVIWWNASAGEWQRGVR
ncbi:hypothetical protein [Streptomyces apricus]|uniref:Uncharacterized protein n=1 Tax=Streptomyces apricus TaxID=1828112 RepID=A0A5B0BF92_9ACTN|nr:hypothetical protein [Streptomyces apricus]KAA0940387.1 hypothetical protein FGF04_09865 [Streptomyces apricus]